MEKRKAQKKELTLLQAIEKVVELVEDGNLNKESLRKAKPYSSFLAKSYGITYAQLREVNPWIRAKSLTNKLKKTYKKPYLKPHQPNLQLINHIRLKCKFLLTNQNLNQIKYNNKS